MTPEEIQEAIKEIHRTPLEEVIATAVGVLVANEEVHAKYPCGEGAPQELKDYAKRIASVAIAYLGE